MFVLDDYFLKKLLNITKEGGNLSCSGLECKCLITDFDSLESGHRINPELGNNIIIHVNKNSFYYFLYLNNFPV